MICPTCGHESTCIVDVRPADNLSAIRRRRHCTGCGVRFSTTELPVADAAPRSLTLAAAQRVRNQGVEFALVEAEALIEDLHRQIDLANAAATRMGRRAAIGMRGRAA